MKTKGWTALHAAAFDWWLSKRPAGYMPDDHCRDAIVNCVSEEEKRLAKQVAFEYLRVRGEEVSQ